MSISVISSSFTQNDPVSSVFFNEFPYDIVLCSELVSSFSTDSKSLIFNFCIFIENMCSEPFFFFGYPTFFKRLKLKINPSQLVILFGEHAYGDNISFLLDTE